MTGLSRNSTLWSIGALPAVQWVGEIGMDVSSDPVFAGYAVSPKRISGLLTVIRQLLVQQTGPELDRILIGDLSRQLASRLDQVALYGTGAAGNQPLGLINVAGVNQGVAIDPANLHPSFCAVEKLIEDANVSMDNYGVLCSTDSKRILNSTPAFTGGSDSAWEKLRNPQSSPEITDNRCFAGAWNNLTFCLWGRGVEILVDHLALALTGQVKIYATLLADVGVRYPGAFAVTAAVTASA